MVVVHELGPAFKRDDLEERERSSQHTVEISDVKVDHLILESAIVLNRVKPVIAIDITTLCHGVITEIVRVTAAHFIGRALPGSVLINWPVGLVNTVVHELISCPAKLVLCAYEEVDSDDGEDGEDEGLEDADIKEAWDRRDECLNQRAHAH